MRAMPSKRAPSDPLEGRLTITIDEAAELLGLSRNSAYTAAGRGELPTLSYGRRKVVPVDALRRQLAGTTDIETPTSAPKPHPTANHVAARPVTKQAGRHRNDPAA